MSRLDSGDKGRGLYVQRPKPDIYTALLGIALGAILIAILFLYLELARFDFDVHAPSVSAAGTLYPTLAASDSDRFVPAPPVWVLMDGNLPHIHRCPGNDCALRIAAHLS